MTSSSLEKRLAQLERRRPRVHGLDARQARALDDWFKAVTGKRIADMSGAELVRLEQLFREACDAPMGDDAAESALDPTFYF